MSNVYNPHILVLPEDEANEQLANGVKLSLNINNRILIIDKPAKGWLKVIKKYTEQVVAEMRKYPSRIVILLIDFDCDTNNKSPEKRFSHVINEIPNDIKDRTFVLGTLDEPEALRKKLKSCLSLEQIGEKLAEECPDKRNELWDDDMLKHNAKELDRLVDAVQDFLFL